MLDYVVTASTPPLVRSVRPLAVVGKRAGRHGSGEIRALVTDRCAKSGLKRSRIERMAGALFTIAPAEAYAEQPSADSRPVTVMG